jgi:hypothetical protein
MDPFLPAPEPKRWRRGVYVAGLVIPFTALQIWALAYLLTSVHMEGPLRLAFLIALMGSVGATIAGWRLTWRLGHEPVRPALEIRQLPARPVRPVTREDYALARR